MKVYILAYNLGDEHYLDLETQAFSTLGAAEAAETMLLRAEYPMINDATLDELREVYMNDRYSRFRYVLEEHEIEGAS